MTKTDSLKASVEEELEKRTKLLEEFQKTSRQKEIEEAMRMEATHLAAAEELEGLYEKRLALEGGKLKQLQAAKDDMQFTMEEKLRRLLDDHETEKETIIRAYQVGTDVPCLQACLNRGLHPLDQIMSSCVCRNA